jgi:ketosteroid isomerase-like protein
MDGAPRRKIHSEDTLTRASFRYYHPYTIMAQARIPVSVRLGSVAALVMVFVLAGSAAQQSPGMPRAQRHESRHEIDQLEQVWRDAIIQRNAPALDGLLADDYIAITPNGTLQSKDQTLANLRSGATHLNSIELSDRKVRFYGQTALVTSRAEVSGTNAGETFSGSYRYTRVYVRDEQGKWKIVSFEASRIRESDDHK